jgi:hypothetical protein
MSTRQQIVDAIYTRLVLIKAANGYATNAGAKVDQLRTTPIAESELPIICLDDTTTRITEDGNYLSVSLTVEVTVAMSKNAAPSFVRAAMNDVVRAVGLDYRLGGLVEKIVPVSTEINAQQAEYKFVAGLVTFQATYREPYPPEIDASGMVPFLRFRDKWDLAPSDGQIDAQDSVDLEGLT